MSPCIPVFFNSPYDFHLSFLEIKHKLTWTRGEGRRGGMGERRGRVRSRNMYKGPMDKDDRGGRGLNAGVGGQGRGEQWGKMGTIVIE